MSNQYKFVFIGPSSKVITGQSLAFSALVNSINTEYHCTQIKIIYNAYFYIKILDALYTPYTWLKFLQALCFYRPDKVYLSLSRSKLGLIRESFFYLTSRLFRTPVVVHLHGLDFLPFSDNLSSVWLALLRTCFKSVRSAIVLSNSMKSQFKKFPLISVSVIPNFVDDELIQGPNSLSKKSQNKPANKVNVVYLSNLMASKGILNFLDALAVMPKQYHHDFNVFIAGKLLGDYLMSSNEIQRVFNRKLGLLKETSSISVRFLGPVFNNEKFELLKKADIFILPTKHKTEAQPISILEAMATGSAIITTEHNIIPEIVQNRVNGILVPIDNPSRISEAIIFFLKNKSLMGEMSVRNRAIAIKNYTREHHVSSVMDILKG